MDTPVVPAPRSSLETAPVPGTDASVPGAPAGRRRHRGQAAPTGRHAVAAFAQQPVRRRRDSRDPATARTRWWRQVAGAALAVIVLVLAVYECTVALHAFTATRTPAALSGNTAHDPVPLPGPAPLPAPAPEPAQLPGPAAAPTRSAPAPGPTSPPRSMLVTPGSRDPGCGAGNPKQCGEQLTLPGGAKFQVYDNYPMAGSAAVTRAVVVVHGTGRNAEGYFQRMISAAKSDGAGKVMVVAPWFEGDGEGKPSAGEATWSNDAWKQGYPAQRPAGLSSFTVMDNLLASLSDRSRFPNLKHITVAGHSAGGQFTQRYAAFGKAPSQLSWVDFNFAVLNPSSYIYFDNQRPNSGGTSFAVPSSSSCSGYSDYKYGLGDRQGYPGQLTAQQAQAQYASRTVTIINGGADDFDNGDLDTDCAAMLQGPNRNSRGQYFLAHFLALQPNAPHNRVVVPGVAHDSGEMFASPLAAPALFGTSAAKKPAGPG